MGPARRLMAFLTILLYAFLSFALSGCGKVWVKIDARSSGQSALYNTYGSGTSVDPYRIYTASQISSLASSPAGWASTYQVENNIDMAGVTISQPIGNSTTNFTGVFNGNSYTISNFTLNDSADSNVGLFGEVSGDGTSTGIIENLTMANATVTASASGTIYVGILAGSIYGGEANNCSSSGTVSVSNSSAYVGGLIGYSAKYPVSPNNPGTFTNSNSSVNISGTWFEAGGLFGFNDSGKITYCHASGNISGSGVAGGLIGDAFPNNNPIAESFATGNVSGTSEVGGLIGLTDGGASGFQNDFATGTVTGTSAVGGLVGWSAGVSTVIIRSYATGAVSGTTDVGGFLGLDNSGGGTTYTGYSYWNNTVNSTLAGIGNATSSNVVGESTTNMQTQSTYSGWNFTAGTGIWTMPTGGANQGYPIFQ